MDVKKPDRNEERDRIRDKIQNSNVQDRKLILTFIWMDPSGSLIQGQTASFGLRTCSTGGIACGATAGMKGGTCG